MAKIDKNANIYDYEGNLISKAPLKRKTLPEVEAIVDDLTKKVQENPENQMYKVYLNNAQSVLFALYNSMSKEDLIDRISLLQNSIEKAKDEAKDVEKEQLDRANEALDGLKSAYVAEEVEQPVVVDTPTVMDEYVNYEEIPADNG